MDRTEVFSKVTLWPKIRVRNSEEKRVRRALQSATKYSLVANSIKGEVIVEPEITIV